KPPGLSSYAIVFFMDISDSFIIWLVSDVCVGSPAMKAFQPGWLRKFHSSGCRGSCAQPIATKQRLMQGDSEMLERTHNRRYDSLVGVSMVVAVCLSSAKVALADELPGID